MIDHEVALPAGASLHPWNEDFRWVTRPRPRVRWPSTSVRPSIVTALSCCPISSTRTRTWCPHLLSSTSSRTGTSGSWPRRTASGSASPRPVPSRSPCTRSAFSEGPPSCRHPALVGLGADLSVPTSTSTGTRRCTRSRRSPAASRGTRTTATRSSSPSSTSRAGSPSPTPRRQRLPAGGARASTGTARCGTTTSTRSAGSASTDPDDGRVAEAAPAASSCSLADPAPHRAQHHRRGAQGLHRPVRAARAIRWSRATRPPDRTHRPRPTTRPPVPGPPGRLTRRRSRFGRSMG